MFCCWLGYRDVRMEEKILEERNVLLLAGIEGVMNQGM